MDVITSICRVSNSLSGVERDQLSKLVECGKCYLKVRAVKLLEEGSSNPILVQYSCGCTPIVVRQHASYSSSISASKALCVTVGRSSSCSHAIVFGEPVRLDHGKTMAALLGCTLQFGGIDMCCE
eukprot:6473440-Amphidinium_carterae.3